MESWTLWVIIALITILIEIFTMGFAVICISFGAISASIIAYFGAGIEWQISLFAASTALAFILVRPLFLRIFRISNHKRNKETNVGALVGREAKVSCEIKDGEGRVKIDGDDWKAEVEDLTEVIPAGERVIILEVRSVILIVKKA